MAAKRRKSAKKRSRGSRVLSFFISALLFLARAGLRLALSLIRLLAGALYRALKFLVLKLYSVASSASRSASRRARQMTERIKPAYVPFEELEPYEGKLKDFEDSLYREQSLIGLIVGSRGSGKSALGMRILENVRAKTKRRVAAMGFESSQLPSWIEPISSIEEIKNGSFVLVDEGGIEFSSRSAMSSANKLLTELLLISRHKDISVLFITQNSANIEVNTLRQVDYLLLKKPSLLQLDFERKKIRDIYEEIKEGFSRHGSKEVFFVYSHDYRGFASAKLPSFWTASLSKSYSRR